MNNQETFTCKECHSAEPITEQCNIIGYTHVCKECYHDIIIEETYNDRR